MRGKEVMEGEGDGSEGSHLELIDAFDDAHDISLDGVHRKEEEYLRKGGDSKSRVCQQEASGTATHVLVRVP